ncbi:head-tail connector protein [Rhizobium aegyptiacum]|uniref:head-tail connector protein n=1 Tax=Rhizobium aegyptiacum TaxID=1764550 RepID=UPI0007E5A64C|nr:head-tail connector protein [Rhizobium aegyptiacum]
MTAVALDEAKDHLRIGFTSDDVYVSSLIEAAEDYVQSIGVTFASPLQPAVRHAVLLIVSHFYNNREAVTAAGIDAMPFGVNALLQPFREQSV